MRPEELEWTARYNYGVLCLHKRDEIEYLGISFQFDSNNPKTDAYRWSVPRSYHYTSQEVKSRKNHPRQTTKNRSNCIDWKYTPVKAKKHTEKIACNAYPCTPGTFHPISAPLFQIKVLRKLLILCDCVEALSAVEATQVNDSDCNEARNQLNQVYDNFVEEHGVINNYLSYLENDVWTDIRLSIRLPYLENIDKSSGTTKITKADIFYNRQFHCAYREFYKNFEDEDVDVRLNKAFEWCIGWYGSLNIKEIASKTNLSVTAVEESLLRLKLIYREPTELTKTLTIKELQEGQKETNSDLNDSNDW